MGQLSFFSADFLPPQVTDLGGLLAAHGQSTISYHGARLSILLGSEHRAAALVAECTARDIAAEVLTTDEHEHPFLLRTDRMTALVPLAAEWTQGSVKAVPEHLAISAGFLRIWAIAAGRADEAGYLLATDPHAPDTVDGLIAGCARAGIAGSFIGIRGGGPGIRIVGHRRLVRLIDSIGTLPSDLPAECFPVEPDLATHGHPG